MVNPASKAARVDWRTCLLIKREEKDQSRICELHVHLDAMNQARVGEWLAMKTKAEMKLIRRPRRCSAALLRDTFISHGCRPEEAVEHNDFDLRGGGCGGGRLPDVEPA